MRNESEPSTYQVRWLKWWVFGTPAVLELRGDHIQVLNKARQIIFASAISDLRAADFDMDTAAWTFTTKDGQKFSIQTHGIFAFANRNIRSTNVNENLKHLMDAHRIPSMWGEPIIKAKK